jgi:hypothetical protein
VSFDPNSTDAVLSRILTRFDQQDSVLKEIKEQVMKTNGRVTDLERDKWIQRGIVFAISTSVPLGLELSKLLHFWK